MKKKAALIVAAFLILAVLVQVGHAATLGGGLARERGRDNRGICRGPCYCADLSSEEQEQIRAACEERREKMDGLREEFRSRQQSLREECLEKLPEAVQKQVQERMAAHGEQGCGRMHGQQRRGEGSGCGFGRQD